MYKNDKVQIFQTQDPEFGLTCAPEHIHYATTRHLAPSKINRSSQSVGFWVLKDAQSICHPPVVIKKP